jgi:large subunit ribosomal protein L10
MERAEKQAEVERLNGMFATTQVTLCGDYRGLSVAAITKLRRELRSKGAQGVVVKNTLARLSANGSFAGADKAQLEKFVSLLKGPSFVVFSDKDPVSPAKVLSDFAKKNDKFKIKGGWLDGAFVDQAGVETLSKMPSREETLGKLLGLLAAPATQLVRLMKAPAQQMVQVLEGHRSNLEKKG